MANLDPLLERVMRLHPRSIDLGLERIERVLKALGNPERKLPPVVHVAGTNGKGSLVAYLRAMAEAAGYVRIERPSSLEDLSRAARDTAEFEHGPVFVHVRVARGGLPAGTGRVALAPDALAARTKRFLST